MKSAERRAERKARAVERQERWESMTPAEKLAELDARLGKDSGAMKQRMKLEKQIVAR